ncbi:endonuclease domain-containing 1 protein-like [Oncorhynchus mykiss]|uniref:Endonuclease domain-containing 1 protein-like n=1 Tax=Oncorhynchus mykiss TaxID=8022 RepID=A0A8C7QIU8_ONCMY|nr:endonuclease domain-containing 1 protein-like [Oncorhynchus mykiss]
MGLRCEVFVLLLFPLFSQGEVTSFVKCSQFFLNHVPPTVLSDPTNNNRYQQICQCLLDNNNKLQYYYATLYDTNNKIPVYSAYELQHADIERKDYWYVEPQLDGGSHLCMSGLNQIPSNNRGDHQALNRDYEKSGYDKGHLYPVHHTSTQSSMLATSTLTNAAPQDPGFNRGQWRVHEEDLAELLNNACSKAYVVTGVVPDDTQIGDGVKVAKYYWSAYCCISKSHTTESAGYVGPDNNGRVQTLTVKDLETRLSGPGYYGSPFYVFQGRC